MRLGFDLDGTLADMHGALAREARGLFPDLDPAVLPNSTPSVIPDGQAASAAADDAGDRRGGPSAEPAGSTSGLTSAQQRELWKAACARTNFWETLDEIEPGTLARLYQLSLERKWEVIFITSRPESAGDTAQLQSHRWLTAHGFRTPSVFVVHGSRGKIGSALALDIIVDDRPENCLDVAIDSTTRPILVWRGDEGKVPGSARQLGIGTVSSIHQCLDILESIDQDRDDAVGMVDRLKRLLGFKPRAARVGDRVHAAIGGKLSSTV